MKSRSLTHIVFYNVDIWVTLKSRSLTHIVFYNVDIWVTLIHYHKHNISPSNSLWDMKQNHWTIKYRSLTYTYLMRLIFASHWSIIPTKMFSHQITLKISSKITRPWNIGHVGLYIFWGQILGHTVSLSENMTFTHQIVFQIQGKITGPWNIGHSDPYLFWSQTSGHTSA